MKITTCLTAFLLLCQLGMAQDLDVQSGNPWTPENLITNVFLGDGVEVLDVTFNGVETAIGFFKDGDEDVGISRGVIMTTGAAIGAGGVNNPGANQASVGNGSTVVSQDLEIVESDFALNDVAEYVITFIPISDTLRFNYSFASEEYPEFACTQYNDVFGFFISGPGINGPYQDNAINIAKIPGTDLPVTINNVNPGVPGSSGGTVANCTPPNGSLAYSEYYVNNNGSNSLPIYDGLTTVLTAEAVVMPCSTYTIRLAIADASDGIYDSGVFLEAKSFGTGTLDVDVATVSLDGTVAEGCTEGVLTFSLGAPVESDLPIDYTILGTATNGVDYQFIPPDIFIPAGDSTVSVPIIAFDDGIVEGTEFILVDVQRDICNRDTFRIPISDNLLVPPDLRADTTICVGDSVFLDGTLQIDLPPPPSFSNTNTLMIEPANTEIYSNIDVFGVQPFTLGPGSILSVCIDDLEHNWIDDLQIYLLSPGGQILELVTDIGNNGDDFLATCFTPGATTPITSVTAADQPFTGEWAPEGVWSDLWDGENPANGTWQLLLRDKFAPDVGILRSWTITFNSVYQVSYEWTPAAGLSCTDCPDPVATPDTTTTYVLEAQDSYGCSVFDSITIEVLDRIPAPNLQCEFVSGNSITVSWDDVPGAQGYEVSIDGGIWEPANTGMAAHAIAGLVFDQTVTFEVRGLGDCPGETATITCTTLPCSAPVSSATVTSVSCNGGDDGTVTLAANGGVPPYSFELQGGTGPNSTGEFTGLIAGMYTAIILDAADCPGVLQFEITEPEPLDVDFSVLEEISCNGEADASATVIINGGSGPFSFQWDNGELDSIAISLDAGLTSVQVTDANNCISTVEFTLLEPEPLSLDFVATDVSCGGAGDGALSAVVAGGTAPYTYAWSPNAAAQVDSNIVNLAGGDYLVTVTDSEDCIITGTFAVGENDALSLALNVENASCAGASDGVAVALVTGGTGPGTYTYAWNNIGNGSVVNANDVAMGLEGSSYEVIVTDEDGCSIIDTIEVAAPPALDFQLSTTPPSCVDFSDGQAMVTISGGTEPYTYQWSDIGLDDEDRDDLEATSYTVTVSDANDCTVEIPISLPAPNPIELSITQTPVSCDGGMDGTATVVATGGAEGFSYLWEDGQDEATATGLTAGMQSVQVMDQNGCIAEIMVTVESNMPIELSVSFTDALCAGEASGTATVEAMGGTGVYTYEWQDGQANQTATALAAGTYNVTVYDENDCSETITVTLGEATALSSTITPGTVSCFGDPDGAASISVSGGTPPYTYLWSSGATSETAGNLGEGTYQVTVTDANGCTLTDETEVTTPNEMILAISGTNILCNGGTNGNISVEITGGEPPYTYNWNTGIPSTPSPNNLGAGNYSVTVEDNNGCTETISITLSEPQELRITSANQSISCHGESDGAINISVSGGIAPYNYFWSNGSNEQDVASLQAGNYTVTVVDANACQMIYDVLLTEPEALRASFDIQNLECFGDSDGSIETTISGGVAPYDLEWATGNFGEDITALNAGVYPLQITDANGCILQVEAEVTQPDAPVSIGLDPIDVSCFGASDGMIVVDAQGGTPFYTYSLDNETFTGSSTLIGLNAGTYLVYVRDANGCLYVSDNASIAEPDPISVDLGADFRIKYGDTAILSALVTGAQGSVFYEWTPIDSSCFDCPELAVDLDYQTSYRVKITDENGCSDEDVVTVSVEKDFKIDVPTGFTPNDDNINDRLLVHGQAGTIVQSFRIYDRWGELLYEDTDFEVNSSTRGWDGLFRGEKANSGVYIWVVDVQYVDGFEEQFKGHTTLIR